MVAQSRKFGGRTFILRETYPTKAGAVAHAKRARKRGSTARVVKEVRKQAYGRTSLSYWHVYTLAGGY